MTADRIDRKLAAILAADVAGYSRLMGADEEGTLGSLNGHRREHIDPSIAKHRGRLPSGSRQLSRIIALINQRDSDFMQQQGCGNRAFYPEAL